ncbi:alkaline phosphatase family protein [Kitasatospora sp. NPDC006697]|uniref:alkaline phosphatase family protein n=1 Tax=Kitasatospora sp. NPDC006697 TaxID=3364020 RepID=UPI0036B838A0
MRLPRSAGRLAATLGVLCGLVTGATGLTTATATAATPAAATATSGVPRPDHVVVVMFENTSESSIIGNSQAPYFNQLATTGADFTNSYAIEHPSEPNYLDLFSGSNQGVTNDSCPHTFAADNEGAELIAKGLSFTGYAEDLPSAGSTVCTSGDYARKHNPWVNFSNVPAADNQPFSAFPTDYTQLPTVSWVVPNLCNDMHDCSIATGDSWLKSNLDAYVQWAKTHNSLLITTFDEDDSTTSANQIATIFDGQPVKAGSYGERIDHFSVLRTIEDMYGLPHAGAAASATPITDAWSTGTPAGVTVTNPGAQTATTGTAASLQLAATDTAAGTLSWSATGLPAGLSINAATGLVSGTPTGAGSSTVTVTATDSTGPSGSATFSWTVNRPGGCQAAQLLGDPGFESGGTGSPWNTSSGVFNSDTTSEPAHAGSWDAWLDGYGSSHTDTVAQTVTVPSGCKASLSFWLHVDTANTARTAQDTLKLQANGTTVGSWSNLSAGNGYSRQTVDLSAYAGQSVTVQFTGTETGHGQTSFVLDDTALNAS